MKRRRVKMSRMGDSVRGANLNSAYEYYKKCHEQNQEELRKISARLEAKRRRKYYTAVWGTKHEVSIDMALSFANEEHVLKAIFHLKEENPKMHLPLERIKVDYLKEILQYIINNCAIYEHGCYVTGNLYIL